MLNKSGLSLLGLWLLLASINATAAIDVYQFSNDSDRVRFHQLTGELRCPKCQNQNIADSNAPIAQDLRTKIQAMLTEKKTDAEIIDYMIDRYGDFVLYQPRVDRRTWLLWFGPAALLILGIIVVVLISRRNASKNTADKLAVNTLDTQQQKQIESLLNDTGNHSS
ncbi:MAG: cytochrome c-type biogenesis protein CcmH [Methylococcaceae bacterium]|nr:cytochrome c-type biogenesis protein CcmH [Methylococcaceae bacterium]